MNKNQHILVVPYNEDIIRKIKNRALVVKVDNVDFIHPVDDIVKNEGNKLHCILLKINSSLSLIDVKKDWENIPIALYVSELGDFRDFIIKRNILKELNIRIFMPVDIIQNVVGLQILSSLNIPCGVFFNNKIPNWDELNDLMYYAIYGKANHAQIEPFNFITTNYNPEELINFSSVYFNDPDRYLHIDKDENIAVYLNDIDSLKVIDNGLDKIDNIHKNQDYKNILHSWKDQFLKMNNCSCCEAWRICCGFFKKFLRINNGCKEFMKDLLETSEFYQLNKKREKQLWQP